jgi:hypothetical protein
MKQDNEAEFARITETLGPQWHSVYEPLVFELMDLRSIAADLLARYKENPVGRGAKGQEVKSPILEQYLAVSNRAAVLGEMLLLTPRSRKRAGVSDAADDDTPFAFLDGED